MTILRTATNVLLRIVNAVNSRRVAVFDNNNNRILQRMEITACDVQDSKKVFEHPIEDGSVIVDGIVDSPLEVTLEALIYDDDVETISALNNLYDDSTLIQVRTKGEVHTNLIIAQKPRRLSSAYINKREYSIQLKEVLFAQVQYVSENVPRANTPANPKNANTVKGGQKTASPSVLGSIFRVNR